MSCQLHRATWGQFMSTGMGSPYWHVSMVDIHRVTFDNSCIALDTLEWLSRQIGRQSNRHKWLVSCKILSAEEPDTLPTGTKPRTPYHWLPRGEVWKEEVLDNLPWKWERVPLSLVSIRWTLQLFQTVHNNYTWVFLSTQIHLDIINWSRWHFELNYWVYS